MNAEISAGLPVSFVGVIFPWRYCSAKWRGTGRRGAVGWWSIYPSVVPIIITVLLRRTSDNSPPEII